MMDRYPNGKERVADNAKATGEDGAKGNYGAKDITVLEGLEAVRKRPGMYIGSTGPRGLHHLVYEVVDNSVDEALAGHCDRIDVDAPPRQLGAPSTTTAAASRSTCMRGAGAARPLEVVLTMLHAGGKFGGERLQGLRRPARRRRLGRQRALRAARRSRSARRQGLPPGVTSAASRTAELDDGRDDASDTGTTITFLPDAEIFEEIEFDFETLAQRLRETAFLTRGLRIVARRRARRAASATSSTTRAASATSSRTSTRARSRSTSTIVYFEGENDEGAGRGRDAVEHVLPGVGLLVRQQHQHARGRHAPLRASRSALTRTLNTYARDKGLLKEKDDEPRGRGRPRGPHGGHLGEAARPAVRGPDEDEARQPADARASSSRPSTSKLAEFLEENPTEARADHHEGDRGRAGARRPRARRAT